MYVVASFENSLNLELAITELETKGIKKEDIFAIPLKPTIGQTQLFDTIHRSDGMSFLDFPSILGTLLAVLGASYGYILKWGPIIWGLIGLGIGFSIGFIVKLIINKKKIYRKKKNEGVTEVILMVKCYKSQTETIEQIFYKHFAFGYALLNQE